MRVVRLESRSPRLPDDPRLRPRLDLVEERELDLYEGGAERGDEHGQQFVQRFVQVAGPFEHYLRTVTATPTGSGEVHQVVEYSLRLPFFGWLFALPVRRLLGQPRSITTTPWWAPPDRISARQVRVLALLAVAAWTAIFANTLFTQTANFAADSFGMDGSGQAVGGVIVRLGVVISLPFAMLADRRGRRRILVALAWVTPVSCAVGALAPDFWTLVATQSVARPLGLTMSLLIGVIAAEEMPRNSRAYAISVIAMSGGFGAGVAVITLKLADLGSDGWRLVYAVALIWLVVAVGLQRGLPETRRFQVAVSEHRADRQRISARRFAIIVTVSFVGNVFIAPVSYFQNRYLDDVRGYSAGGIALFTLVTATPASIGLIVGGSVAERFGRRKVLVVCLPAAAAMLVATYATSGASMWLLAFAGAVVAGLAYPAFAVYRTELAPTADRGRANGWFTVAALAGGSIGLLAVGWAIDHGWSYGTAMAVVGVCQLAAAVIAAACYPETAHLTLEQINPGDPAIE